MTEKPKRPFVDRVRVWTDAPIEPPAGGSEIHGRQVVGVEENGNVRWIDTHGEGCSTPARWREWEADGDELVRSNWR